MTMNVYAKRGRKSHKLNVCTVDTWAYIDNEWKYRGKQPIEPRHHVLETDEDYNYYESFGTKIKMRQAIIKY